MATGPLLLSAIPLLRINSSAAALKFYCRGLGFTVESVDRGDDVPSDPCYICVARDEVRLHLSSHGGDGVMGHAVGVWVRDVVALHREFVSRGVTIALPPTDQKWGNREMYVRDPDGNTIRFLQAVQ